MTYKILITGPPRCGKSTLIMRLIEYFNENYFKIQGFITPEIKENNKRVGFAIKRIRNEEETILAKKGNFQAEKRLGNYSIFINKFENFIQFLEIVNEDEFDFIIIDEIGKMELHSEKFARILKSIFMSNLSVIASIGLNLKHKLKDWLLSLDDIVLYHVNKENQKKIFDEIISKIQ
ncbi:MAG: nucleoside-triphosphatase [Candidatus Lokiarchaeota archaeon]